MSEILLRDVLARVGGRSLARHGALVSRSAPVLRGGEEQIETFSRPDGVTSIARTVGRDGVTRLVAQNRPRIEYVDLDGDGIRETPGLLMEPTRENRILRSEELDNGAWGVTQVTFGSNVDIAPDGTQTAERLIEAATSSEHMVSQGVAGTADVRHAGSVFARAGTRTWLALTIRDVLAGTNRVQAWFNLATGAVGQVGNVGAGTNAAGYIERYGNGWYRCGLVGACNNGDTTPILTVQVANADGSLNYAGDGASYISAWGAQFENNVAYPSSYLKTVAGTVTRSTDVFTSPVGPGRVLGTLYIDAIERMVHVTGADSRFIMLAASGFVAPYFAIRTQHANVFSAILDTGAGLVQTGSLSLPGFNERIRAAARIVDDGIVNGVQMVHVEFERRIGGGAIGAATPSASTPLGTGGWSAQTLRLSNGNGVTGDGRVVLDGMWLGTPHTLAECEAFQALTP